MSKIFLIFVLLQSGLAWSAESVSEWYSHFHVNYFAIYHGSPVAKLGAPYTVDQNGNPAPGKSINFDSELTAAYMITDTIGIGPTVPFILVPVKGEGVILGDVGVKAFNRKLVSHQNLSVYGNLILQAPTNSFSQQRGMSFAIKTTPNIRYAFSASRFSVGAWTEAKSYLGVSSGKTLKLYAAPYINYRLSPTFSLNLEYELEVQHNQGTSTFDLAIYQTDLQPGVVWNVTSKILVNPYLQIFTGKRMTWDTMALGAVISATVL